MKILQLTSHLNVGGITRYILVLSKQLMARNHEVMIASDDGSTKSQVKNMGLHHWHLPFNTSVEFSPRVFWGMQQLVQKLVQKPVDVIHAHTRVAQVVAELISRRLKIPYVTTWHGIYKPRLGRRLWPCAGKLTIAISDPVRQKLQQDFHISEKNIRCIHNGIDTDYYTVPPDESAVRTYQSRWKIFSNQPVIGSIGRLAAGKVKGFDTLLVAVYLLKMKFPGIQLLLAGDGPRYPFLEDVVRRLGLLNSVRFVGETADIRVPLALMDLFVFSSRWPEAFGLTLVEAMASGKPIVATRVGAVPEIIQHGINGWTIPSDDPLAMAEGIARLLNDRALASQYGRQAQIRAREAFNFDRMTSQIEAVYREVLDLPHKKTAKETSSINSAGH